MPVPDYRLTVVMVVHFSGTDISQSVLRSWSKIFWVLKTTSSTFNCTLGKCVPCSSGQQLKGLPQFCAQPSLKSICALCYKPSAKGIFFFPVAWRGSASLVHKYQGDETQGFLSNFFFSASHYGC